MRSIRRPSSLGQARRLSSSLFSAPAYQATRRPLAEARTLPGHVYHDPVWYKSEVKHLLAPSWVLAGRAEEMPESGSFLRLDLPGAASTLLVRGKDKRIRAWANVCTHRGAALTRAEHGRFPGGIVCPYHAWTFDPTSGALRGVPKKSEMPECFKKEEWPLREVRLAEYRGFLFVAGSEEAPPFEDSLGNCPELVLADWPFEDFVTVGRREYTVDCNWKFLMQNTSETYHTSYVHRETLGPMASEPVGTYRGVAPAGNWDAVHVPGDRSIVPLPGEAAPFPELPSCPTTFFVSLFPTLQLNVTRDCAWWMRVLPEGPSTTRVTQGFLFPRETTTLPDFDALLQPYLHRWHVAVEEDNEISINQQRASESPHHRPGPYHQLEFAVQRFDNMVLDAVLDGEAAAAAAAAEEESQEAEAAMLSTPLGAVGGGAAGRVPNPVPAMLKQTSSLHSTAATIGSRLTSSGAGASYSLSPGASVCVTGASGFIALHLVEQLLTAGYRVTAAVRSDSPSKLAPLNELASLGELRVVSGCDLLTKGSFDAAVADAEVCFHTVSATALPSPSTCHPRHQPVTLALVLTLTLHPHPGVALLDGRTHHRPVGTAGASRGEGHPKRARIVRQLEQQGAARGAHVLVRVHHERGRARTLADGLHLRRDPLERLVGA